MSYIETSPVKNSTIMLLYSEKDEIKLDPPYQRMGGVWTKEKKQLLIDSILNDYDIPKIYFHEYSRENKIETGINFAVIDGRQRLETIWEFIEGKYTLSDDFEYQKDKNLDLAGLGYDDIANSFPKVKIKFDSFVLPVIAVDTDDEDLIEDMFSRLNEAVPLNAAEKRNSIGGNLVIAIRELSEHFFFRNYVKYSNKRFQYRETIARFLLIEENILNQKKIYDTKKVYLDALAKKYHNKDIEIVEKIKNNCEETLNIMINTFSEKDILLRSQGNMVVYYLIFKYAIKNNEIEKLSRFKFVKFNKKLKENREKAEKDYENSSYDLLEFDRLSQQGTNDSSNIKERYSILANYLDLTAEKFN